MNHHANHHSSPQSHGIGWASEPGPTFSNEARSGVVNSAPIEVEDAPQESSSHPRRKRQRGESSRTAVAYSRKRAVAACRNCRVRKIKCNNARPSCGSCVSSHAQCDYEESQDHSAFDPASLLILDRLNQVLSKLDNFAGPHPGITPTSHLEALSTPPNNQPRAAHAVHVAHIVGEIDGAYDDRKIPCAKASPDAILQWPIFQGQFPPNYIIDGAFLAEMPEENELEFEASEKGHGAHTSKSALGSRGVGIDEEATTELVQRFLDLVHIKNPILDPETIWLYVRRVTEDGFQWDPPSCLVLLACALGSIAESYESCLSPRTHRTSLDERKDEIRMAEKYFNLAQRRLGLLGKGILTPQCHFLAGVYLMYSQRPLSAWSEFHSASKSYHIYLQCRARHPVAADPDSHQATRRRGLEQRLYWSCYKSECELRAEMELPNSSLADFQYPDMLPSPPELASPGVDGGRVSSAGSNRWLALGNSLDSQRQHEQSWFYYLTEITLRRISNRVLNMLYNHELNDTSIPFLVKTTSEIEQQLREWQAGLPAPIQFTEGVLQSEELPCMVQGRALEIKSWLFRPFLHFAIHQSPNSVSQTLVLPYVKKALGNDMTILRCMSNLHRHHGTWFGLRACTAASLSILGAVRCGRIDMPHGWEDLIRDVMGRFRYWEAEAPGLDRSIEAVETIMSSMSPR